MLYEKSQSGVRKPNRKQEQPTLMSLWFVVFVASLCVLIFAVVGHDTINIPEVF